MKSPRLTFIIILSQEQPLGVFHVKNCIFLFVTLIKNIVKILKALFLKNTSGRLVLIFLTFQYGKGPLMNLIVPNVPANLQKQPSRRVLRKRCSENMQQTHMRTPMAKCNFIKVVKQL